MCKTEHRIEVEPEPGPSETQHMIGIADSLRQEIEQLKTELAETHGRLMVDRWLLTRRADNIDNALRDILAPTFEVLRRYSRNGNAAYRELVRLNGIVK